MKENTNHIDWKVAWKNIHFKRNALFSLALLLLIGLTAPLFFNFIENRNGIRLRDPILNILPAYDVSVPIFTILWLIFTLALVRSVQSPRFFLLFTLGYTILCLSRLFTIALIPLNPPTGIIELTDPLTNIFYGNRFISKDLFYSGHASTLLLMALCFTKKTDKILGFTAAAVVSVLLLIQHVHYTIDILAAPFFSLVIFGIAKKSVSGVFNQNASPNWK